MAPPSRGPQHSTFCQRALAGRSARHCMPTRRDMQWGGMLCLCIAHTVPCLPLQNGFEVFIEINRLSTYYLIQAIFPIYINTCLALLVRQLLPAPAPLLRPSSWCIWSPTDHCSGLQL